MIEKIKSFRKFMSNTKILLVLVETVDFFFERLDHHYPK